MPLWLRVSVSPSQEGQPASPLHISTLDCRLSHLPPSLLPSWLRVLASGGQPASVLHPPLHFPHLCSLLPTLPLPSLFSPPPLPSGCRCQCHLSQGRATSLSPPTPIPKSPLLPPSLPRSCSSPTPPWLSGLLSPLAAGASVIFPKEGKFTAHVFWQDCCKHGATYYTAVPTMHQVCAGMCEEICEEVCGNAVV